MLQLQKTIRIQIVLLQGHEYKIFQQFSKKKKSKKKEKSSCSTQQNRLF